MQIMRRAITPWEIEAIRRLDIEALTIMREYANKKPDAFDHKKIVPISDDRGVKDLLKGLGAKAAKRKQLPPGGASK